MPAISTPTAEDELGYEFSIIKTPHLSYRFWRARPALHLKPHFTKGEYLYFGVSLFQAERKQLRALRNLLQRRCGSYETRKLADLGLAREVWQDEVESLMKKVQGLVWEMKEIGRGLNEPA
ncbi:MAG: hypothetical protein Q9208_008081 [Pyrenodesmia sp. 3 TL-2023]